MKKQLLVFLVILMFLTGCAAEITGGKILKHGIYTATETKIVKDVPTEEIAKEIVEWINN